MSKYIKKCEQFGDFKNDQIEYQEMYDNAKVVILGVPYDETASYLKGTKFGPEAIINASQYLEMYDDVSGNIYEVGLVTAGILDLDDILNSPEDVNKRIYEESKRFIDDNKFLITIGGEHSITSGAVNAYKQKYGKISVLQLDAHLDLMDSYNGSKYNHACVMRRVIDDYNCEVKHVGIRVVSEDEHLYVKQNGLDKNIFRARDIYNKVDWFKQVIDSLSEIVYITIDVDVFDPSLIPATGTPVPGGLDWYTVLNFLNSVFKEKQVVGMDVVELKPNPGNEAPNFTIADLIYKNIGFYKEYVLKF